MTQLPNDLFRQTVPADAIPNTLITPGREIRRVIRKRLPDGRVLDFVF